MEEEDLRAEMTRILESLEVTPERAKEISRGTQAQANCALWVEERRNRLTSSNCGVVARLLDTTPRSKTVHKIVDRRDLR